MARGGGLDVAVEHLDAPLEERGGHQRAQRGRKGDVGDVDHHHRRLEPRQPHGDLFQIDGEGLFRLGVADVVDSHAQRDQRRPQTDRVGHLLLQHVERARAALAQVEQPQLGEARAQPDQQPVWIAASLPRSQTHARRVSECYVEVVTVHCCKLLTARSSCPSRCWGV